MSKLKKQQLTGYALIAPLSLGCLIFYAIPFLMVLFYSFMSRAGRNGRFVGLKNYREVLTNEVFLLACKNTVRYLVIVLPMILILSYAVALFLMRASEFSKWLKPLLLLPFIMPVTGSVLLVEQTRMNMEMLYLWKNTGYSVILLLAGLMAIDKMQYDCASLDGANGWKKFIYITMPQMRFPVFFACLFSLINAFKSFRDMFLIGGQYPKNENYMLQHYINNNFEKLNYSKLSVASVLLFSVVTICVGSLFLWVRKREEA